MGFLAGQTRNIPPLEMTQKDQSLPFLTSHVEGVVVRVKVVPRSSKNAIAGVRGDSLVIKITAPPVEGQANKALLKFLGKKLGIPPSSIAILSGSSSREKTLLLKGLDQEVVRSIL